VYGINASMVVNSEIMSPVFIGVGGWEKVFGEATRRGEHQRVKWTLAGGWRW